MSAMHAAMNTDHAQQLKRTVLAMPMAQFLGLRFVDMETLCATALATARNMELAKA